MLRLEKSFQQTCFVFVISSQSYLPLLLISCSYALSVLTCRINPDFLFRVSQLDKDRHFVEIYAFTQNCNWLDVVEVTFHSGRGPGNIIIIVF